MRGSATRAPRRSGDGAGRGAQAGHDAVRRPRRLDRARKPARPRAPAVVASEVLRRHLRCIDSWGGTVEKYIGDAILAVFGVPAAHEDDAERAMRAALEILQRLEELNPGFERHHGVTLQVRVGVNTGEVIAPASDDVSQAIVAGDAVNVAARLEQAARPGPSSSAGEPTRRRGALPLRGPDRAHAQGQGGDRRRVPGARAGGGDGGHASAGRAHDGDGRPGAGDRDADDAPR